MSPNIQNSDLLKAIETAIPAFVIEEAIANTQTQEERKRSLPAQLVVSLVIAMSLWSRDSMRDVLKNLIDGMSEAWVKVNTVQLRIFGGIWVLCRDAPWRVSTLWS